MVGRMSKRNKRARTESEQQQQPQSQSQQLSQLRQEQQQQSQDEQGQEQQQQQSPKQWTPPTEGDIVQTSSLESSASDFAVSPEDSIPAWSGDLLSDPTLGGMLSADGFGDLLLDGQTNAASSESNFEFINTSNTSPNFDFDLLNADLSINQFVIPNLVNQKAVSSARPCFTDSTPPSYLPSCPQVEALTTSHIAEQHEPYADKYGQMRQYPHVLALTRIIELLEAHIQLQKTAIDELMRVNKACMIDIARIMELKEYALCKSCGILVPTAMELVVTLYEKGVSSENTASPKQQSQQSTPCGSELPNLQFGVFQVDPEEQIAFRNRIICKELQRGVEIIKRFSDQNQNHTNEGSHSGRVHKQWYVEMEHRAKKLVSSLGGWFD